MVDRHQGPPQGEDDIIAMMRADGLAPHAWGNARDDTYGWHEHGYERGCIASAARSCSRPAAVARSLRDWWNTPRYRDRIALNDRVWLQIVGPDRPGIYYLASIVSLPYESPEEEFGLWHTDIRWDYRIDPPLARLELVNDPALQSFVHCVASRVRTCPCPRRLHQG